MSSETPSDEATTALLPTDILINVLHYLTPWETLTFRRACRHFRDASMHRVVWIHALQRVIDDNNVFPPSFPLEKMSLSELTHAVFAPRKFFNLVLSADTLPDQKVAPTAQFIATLWDNEEDLGNHSYQRVHLLSGGRFVVAAMQKVMRIFDTGYGPRPTVRTRPIFTLRWTQLENIAQGVENTWCEVSHLEWEANGESSDLLLFVTVTPYPRTTRPASIVVYKISDLASSPQGQQVAHLTLYSEMSSVHIKSVEGTRLAFTASESLVGVWDYADNSISMWRTESLQHAPVHAGLNNEETPTFVPMNVAFHVGSTVASYRRGKDRFFDVQAEQGLVVRYVLPDAAPNAPGAGTALIRASPFRVHEEYPAEIIDILRLPNLHVGDEGVYTGIHCPGLYESDPPGDIARVSLHLIFGYVDPPTIFRLRAVCIGLRDATLHRAPWIQALRAIMQRNDVFSPSYPLSDMSVAELEHAVISPIKFSETVKQRGVRILSEREMTRDTPAVTVPKLHPARQRTVRLDTGEAPNAILRHDLLPGGRYSLLTTAKAIHIFDLGYRPGTTIDARPVFTLRQSDLVKVEVDDNTPWRMDQWSAGRSSGDLLLSISVQQPSTSILRDAIVIYKVVHLGNAPLGCQVARLTLPAHFRPRVHNAEDNRICFASATGTVGVWDFARKRAARWQTESRSARNLSVLSRDSVIHCDPVTGTVVYNIPPLAPTSAGAISLLNVQPAFPVSTVIPHSSAIRSSASYATYHIGGQEYIYDLRGNRVRRYVVREPPSGTSRTSALPVEATSFMAHEDPEIYVTKAYLPHLHVCEDGIFTGSHSSGFLAGDLGPLYEGAGISLHMSGRQYGTEAHGIDVAVTLLDHEEPGYRHEWNPELIDFCPVSGRLCAVECIDGRVALSVFDYIAPCARDLLGGGWRRFSKLPDDVWMNIMRYVKPLDILALRQTSRRMKGPSLNRAVWMHALRVVVADNNVHPLTFPIEKMSTAELENAASCPQKLTRILLRAGQSFLAPVPQPEPVHRRAFVIKQEGDKPAVRSIRLLPGGRFLVVERLESVLIMDLGWRTEAVIRRSPIYI
ncbi:hypothetical protein FB107DRAFT_285915 [Schizophyllum commune]